MELWSAFLLGLTGSVHCAGMCGPLVMALPKARVGDSMWVAGRVAYNSGRVSTYSLMGACCGALGERLAIAGMQRWVSLAAGVLVLLSLLVKSRFASGSFLERYVGRIKLAVSRLLRVRTLPSLFALGLINGILPCGLVYVALAAAVASNGLVQGALYMAVFGLGTTPMMLAVGFVGPKLAMNLRWRLQRLAPLAAVMVGVLLVLRGLALGIPYVSPNVEAGHFQCVNCR